MAGEWEKGGVRLVGGRWRVVSEWEEGGLWLVSGRKVECRR